MTGIEAMLNLAQLCWPGHVSRMDNSRLPRQPSYAELSAGRRHIGVQRKRYKDTLKSTLKAHGIPVDKWQAVTQDRTAWRVASLKGSQKFEEDKLQTLDEKRLARKNRVTDPSDGAPSSCAESYAHLFGGFKLTCANTNNDTDTVIFGLRRTTTI